MTKYCEKLTGLLQEFNSGNELTAFDSLASGPAEKLQLQAKLEAKFEPIYELMREIDPFLLWNKYKDGEVIWDFTNGVMTSTNSVVANGEGIISRLGTTLFLNGKLLKDFSSELSASGLGQEAIELRSHPLGYMVSIGQDVWINGEKQPVGQYPHENVRPHPKGFVGYSHPGKFYLNDNEKIDSSLPERNVIERFWLDGKGEIYMETLSPGGITFASNLYSSRKGRIHTSVWSEYSPYTNHPDGYLEHKGKKVYVNGKKLVYILDNENNFANILPYPGGVIVPGVNSDYPDRTVFVFYDGSSLPENQPKKSIFNNFLNRSQK
jgi:hypothetical protein